MTPPPPRPDAPARADRLLARLRQRAVRQAPALQALELPNYRRWAAADLLSNVGSWMSTAALGWLAYHETGSAAALGTIIAVKQVPGVLLGLLGGAVADRVDSRRALAVTQSAYSVLAAGLSALVITGQLAAWHLYLYAAATGLLAVLDGPCFGRLLAEVLGREHLSRGIALGSVSHSAGWVMGLGLGSVVVAGPGAGAVFVLDALSFAVVALTVVRLRTDQLEPLERSATGHTRVRDGLRHVLHHRRLRTLLGVAAVTGALGRHYQVTMAAMVGQSFGGGAGTYARLFTAFSVGALLGAALAARTKHLRLPVLLTAAAGAAVVQALSGGAPSAAVFGAAMVAAACLNVLYDTSLAATVQHQAHGAVRGRVLAVQGLIAAAASLAGAPTLGWLADHIGVRLTLVLAGTTCLVAVTAGAVVLAGGWGALLPTVRGGLRRRSDRPPVQALASAS